MKTKILIMADGLGSRWDTRNNFNLPAPFKQLLPINGRPLLARTIEQAKSLNLDNITLICPDFFSVVPELKGVHMTSLGYKETQVRPLLDGILRTQHLWEERTVILLGDVCYSNFAINFILKNTQNACIYGRQGTNPATGKTAGELFSLSFCADMQDQLIKEMARITLLGKGKLWDLLKQMDILYVGDVFDYTDDTDSPEAYKQFWHTLCFCALNDDANKSKKCIESVQI